MATTNNTTLLITGGAGFIGSACVRLLTRETNWHVIDADKLAYAGSPEPLAKAAKSDCYAFEQVSVAVDTSRVT